MENPKQLSSEGFKSLRSAGKTDSAGTDNCCSHDHEETDHDHDHDHGNGNAPDWKTFLPAIVSFSLLLAGIVLDQTHADFFKGFIRFACYAVAYILVGGKVLIQAFRSIRNGGVFNEFMLMGIATVGAFYIGEYAEGVAVMLFYVIGEHFQEAAILRSRNSIRNLIDNRPLQVTLVQDGIYKIVDPKNIRIGDVLQIKAGEKVALDGELLSESSSFNTAALTGESKPDTKAKGEMVLAGMINLDRVVELKVTSLYDDSVLSKILKMVERATSRKAKTQQFITKFARIYTPAVVFMAIAVTFLPYFFINHYVFNDWLYRALIFLVISCPCALVISIPLGYFGGIGAASKNGILFKGSVYLDEIAKADTIVMDKTGTLTKGVFKVQEIKPAAIEPEKLIAWTAALESKSTHPVAKAITAYAKGKFESLQVTEIEELPGYGLKGKIENSIILAGNSKLLAKFNIPFDREIERAPYTNVVVAIDNQYVGYITIADEIKDDARQAIDQLRQSGIRQIIMLSGDKQSVVEAVAKKLGIETYFGGLLPEDKVDKVEELKSQGKKVAFIGDGINDAPVIALADIGIAMGGLGSDAAIETADVIIQNDQPSKIITAIKIGKATSRIVWQNIGLSFFVKAIVLILGAGGLATMWEAVFADVGVAFLAILNAVRIQRMKF